MARYKSTIIRIFILLGVLLGGFTVFLVVSLFVSESTPRGPYPTIPGPESSELIQQVSGTIVHAESPEQVRAIVLPERNSIPIPVNSPMNTIWAVSGPDSVGRIVYLEESDHDPFESFSLILASISGGKPETILTRTTKSILHRTKDEAENPLSDTRDIAL